MAKIYGKWCMLVTWAIFLVIAIGLTGTVVAVEHADVNGVIRYIQTGIYGEQEFEVTLCIDGEFPLVVGIVDLIPEGFEFPEDDEISDYPYFEVDREGRRISFAVIDQKEITYRVVAPLHGQGTFKGNWVDLLVLSSRLDEGHERCKTVEETTLIVE